jgi:hypothetical protein
MQDEQIAAVEQVGRRFVAYLLDHPQIRAEGATQEAALENLAAAAHRHHQISRSTTPLVKDVIIQTRQA